MDTAQDTTAALPTWRLRVELDDHPGTLAKLTASLAAKDCNILALTVLPVPDGVVDDLIVRTPADLRPAELVTLVRALGGRCAGITKADLHDLTDAPTAALRTVTALAAGSAGYAEAMRDVLGADSAEPAKGVEGVEGTDAIAEFAGGVGARQVRVPTPGDAELVVRRGWAAFTEVELARATALADVARTVEAPAAGPEAVLTSDGAGVVLRAGAPGDADAVAAMHDRCSGATLFARYHAGTRSVPRRMLNRLLTPPRGQTTVAVLGHQVIALGQLISTVDPAVAEVSILVEDDWQARDVGTALLRHLVRAARAAGHTELIGWCLPTERGLLRTAARAGIPTSTTTEDGALRVSLDTHTIAPTPAHTP